MAVWQAGAVMTSTWRKAWLHVAAVLSSACLPTWLLLLDLRKVHTLGKARLVHSAPLL